MANVEKKHAVVSSLFWKFAERIGAQGVNLIVSIILARLIAPEEYGIVALTTIFITISNVFIETGLPTALIQKKDADDLDFSSVFYFNILLSIILYSLIFVMAPIAANFYGIEELEAVLRVLGITILIAGLKSMQNAYVSRNMLFKKFFISTLVGTVISAIIGIWMAYKGFGVWALVTQQLLNVSIDTFILWIIVKWRPTKQFSFKRLKELFKYGWKILCSGIIDVLYNELYGLVIGKKYNSADLAYYNKANNFPRLIVDNVNGSISSVILPVLSKEQDNKEKLKNMMRKTIKTSAFFIFPMMFGLAAVSETLIIVLLTENWIEAAPLMKILCFSFSLWPIHTINVQAISAIGRSDICLKIEILKKVVGIIALVASIPFGIEVMVMSKLITSIASAFINAYPNKKLLNYSIREQLKDIWKYMAISIFMFVIVSHIDFVGMNRIYALILQVILGLIIYIVLCYILKIDIFKEMLEKVKGFKYRGASNGE